MNRRARLLVVAALAVVLLGGSAAVALVAASDTRSRSENLAAVQTAAFDARDDAGRIVFRDSTPDAGYGFVASVAADDPGGERTVTDVSCDRVYSATSATVCLRIERGILTTFSANLLDADGAVTSTWPLPGIPSRARLSPDGELAAFTSFVTGEGYATIGFSTATRIVTADGQDLGNLEEWQLLVDGEPNTAVDRNFWGVTFVPGDDDAFYATAATGGSTWLVRGSIADRTLTTVHKTAECPSISPDGTRVVYKKNVASATAPHWSLAVLDLDSGEETILPDDRSIDDQAEWLDDSTLLYALPSEAVGDSDVWSIRADGSAPSALFIAHASSPSVVRP
ncbi:hypothetical protein HD599_003463 [Conyzicola lurida]|uniref:WD40 repeat protein n=1 Tax=Conyzicola lurida TaxID=1172621 RepID=A0A841AM93_9MICO|nr:hypothetical protein [Conyzicola lurida]